MTHGEERYQALIGSTLFAATPDDPEIAGTWTVVERDVLSMVMEEDGRGLLTPLFTSLDALARWRPEGGCCVEREAAWHFEVARSDPEGRVVIDPGSPSSIVLAPAEVAALAAGRSPVEAGGGSATMLIATPLEPLPEAIGEAVHRALAAQPAVRSARLFLIDQTGEGPQPVVLVELDDALGPDAVGIVMEAVVADVAARTEGAGGLTFGLVTDGWRPAYESGGLPVHDR